VVTRTFVTRAGPRRLSGATTQKRSPLAVSIGDTREDQLLVVYFYAQRRATDGFMMRRKQRPDLTGAPGGLARLCSSRGTVIVTRSNPLPSAPRDDNSVGSSKSRPAARAPWRKTKRAADDIVAASSSAGRLAKTNAVQREFFKAERLKARTPKSVIRANELPPTSMSVNGHRGHATA